MSTVTDRLGLDPERAWAGAVLAGTAALFGGALAFPGTVYDRFIWKYFWGPVYADAHGVECAWLEGGAPVTSNRVAACSAHPATVAYPGYTVVSEVGYAVVGLTAIVGVSFLLRRLGVDRLRSLVVALFPFMLFGGALRVVEDVNDAAYRASLEAGDPTWLVAYPLNTLLISPIIYVTVFLVVLAALVVSLRLERAGLVDRYEYALAGTGAAAVVGTLALLLFMWTATEYVSLYPLVFVVTVALALAATGAVWGAIERFAPRLNEGSGVLGLLVLVGQAVDGAANVIGLDWIDALGTPGTLTPKHPVNRAVISVSETVLPAAVTDVTGTAWPFLFVKLAAAVLIIWIFDETVFEESPRFAVMLMIGAVAVGLGPGTRDLLRATFYV